MPLAETRRARVEWGQEHCYEKLSNYFDGSSPTRLTESVKDKQRSERERERR
jgi:hypothetical protein